MSPSAVGMLEGGTNLRVLPTTGCDLAPGQYRHSSAIEGLLDKTVSKRGAYDLYTGERYKPPKSLVSTDRQTNVHTCTYIACPKTGQHLIYCSNYQVQNFGC